MMRRVSSFGRKLVALNLLLFMALLPSSAVSAQERPKIEIVPNIPHSLGIKSAAVSSDGKRLVSGGGDKAIKLWDIATGRLLRTFEGHSDDVTSVAFSPDGTRILSGSGLGDHTLRLWDAASGKLIRSWKAHSSGITSVAFSPDGTHLLSAGEKNEWNREDSTGALSLWDAASGQLIRVFEHSDRVTSAAFSLDGTRIISSGDAGILKLWDTATGRLIRTFEGHSDTIRSVAFSPDADRVASGNRDDARLICIEQRRSQLGRGNSCLRLKAVVIDLASSDCARRSQRADPTGRRADFQSPVIHEMTIACSKLAV